MNSPRKLVVFPLGLETPFAEIDRKLTSLGFSRRRTAAADPHPANASWSSGDSTITLECDHATPLQTLLVPLECCADLANSLPTMTVDDAVGLLTANDPGLRLAGLQAAGYLQAISLLSQTAICTTDADARVAQQATETLAVLVAQQAAAQPYRQSRSGLLQTIRRTCTISTASAATSAMLRAELASPDWEIRATTMAAAARMAAFELIPQIATLTFPEDPQIGLGRLENRILLALRDAALQRLGRTVDRALPPGLAETLDRDYSRLEPDVAAFVFSLLEPLPGAAPAPPGAGIVITGQGPTCTDGTLLSWVPSGAYWLGHGHRLRGEPNPARRLELDAGFYIESEAREPCDWATACVKAAERAVTLGRLVTVASDSQWEMAARGPDGRRLPWGQNADPALRVDLSPLGVADLLTGPGEWLAPDLRDDTVRATPGEGRHPLSARITPPADSQLRYRFVYPFTPPQ